MRRPQFMFDMLLTIKEVSDWLNIKPSTLYLWAAQGKIPCRKIHGLIRFERDAILRWLDSFMDEQSKPVSRLVDRRTTRDVDMLIATAKRAVYTHRHGKLDRNQASSERRKRMGLFKRHHVWWMSFSYHGQQIRRSTGTTDKRLAEAILSKVRVQVIEGQYFDRLEEQNRTVEDMMERYVQERVAGRNRNSERRARYILIHLGQAFGSKTLAQVTPKEIAAYKAQRHQLGAKPATIAKELGLLKAAYNVAIREWEWCWENPVCRVAFGRIHNARVRYLDEVTFERAVQACPAWLQPIVLIARYTGIRRENIVTLQWSQVDLDRKLIILDHTKNGDRLGVPLCDQVITTLHGLRSTRSKPFGSVFTRVHGEPLTGDAVGIAFGRACRRVGITDFRFHDLRHTFASSLVQRGVDLYRMQRLLGHRDARMTQRYAHLAPENLRDAIQVFNGSYHKISTEAADTPEEIGLSA